MLTKDLLRVSRAGGGYQPTFAGRDHRPLAARVIGIYQGHVEETRARLEEALSALETEGEADFKLVRGLSQLVDRSATYETRAAIGPIRARTAAFEAAETVGVANADERGTAVSIAADALGVDPAAVDRSLYADLEERQILSSLDREWDPEELIAEYNLSLAQTALFDATEVRIRSDDPRTLVSTAKWHGLLYEVRRTDRGRELLLTGPDALFRATRRYGTRFARLLRTVASTEEWELVATIDDRGTERELRISSDDPIRPPGADDSAISYDSDVESDFAARFGALDLDWDLAREPEPLETGSRVMIPDFAFDYRYADFRVYFEIVGFWTPEYVEKKLEQLANVEDVELLVAVDESLGTVTEAGRRSTVDDTRAGSIERERTDSVDPERTDSVDPERTDSVEGERPDSVERERRDPDERDAITEIEALDHRVIPYTGTVRLKDVRDALRLYERDLIAASEESLPESIVPEDDVVTFSVLAERFGVSEAAIEGRRFPDHVLIGRTLVRTAVLESIAESIESGMALGDVESVLAEWDLTDTSATLGYLGYVVEWEGLSGGTIRERD